MSEPTCRHCGEPESEHGMREGGIDECPTMHFTPGPTYAVLQERLRVAREALKADREVFVALRFAFDRSDSRRDDLRAQRDRIDAAISATEDPNG